MKKVNIFICLLFFVISSFAQRQQISDSFVTPTAPSMVGKQVFSYIVGEDGKHLKDGPYSAVANIQNEKHQVRFRNITVNADYKLNANFKQGLLHGPLNLSARISATYLGKTDTETATLTGNMQDGIPHGIFNVVNKFDGYTVKLNANYNKGTLIGNFSCTTLYNDRPEVIQGTLTSKGELNGLWKYGLPGQDAQTLLFQNGVLLSRSNIKESTPPSLVNLAKKYANKTITDDELAEQGIAVLQDSLPLYAWAVSVIFKDYTIDWRNLGDYSFGANKTVKYVYLKKYPFFTDKGIDLMLDVFKKSFLRGTYSSFRLSLEHSNPSIKIYDKSLLDACTTTTHEERNYFFDLYLSKKQMKRVNDFLHMMKKENILTIQDILERSSQNKDYSDLLKFISGIDDEKIDCEQMQKQVKDFFKYSDEFIDLAPDSTYYQWGRDKVLSPYVDKKSIEILFVIAGITNELAEHADETEKERLKKLEEEINKRMENVRILHRKYLLQERIKPTFDFLSNSSAFSIAYNSNVELYICGLSSGLDLEKKIKPFCKIIAYELIDDDGENVIANVTVKKKKEEIKYQVCWRYESYRDYINNKTTLRYRIDANSIDINKAIVIE